MLTFFNVSYETKEKTQTDSRERRVRTGNQPEKGDQRTQTGDHFIS